MAISSSEWPSRCRFSISSPIVRASSSESHAPVTATFSPGSSSVRSVLPSRPSLCAIRCEAAPRMCAGRAVIALEPDHGRAGKVVLEAQDVVDLGAAPAVDRLVVVADAADVLRALADQPQPQILRDVGVLIFVDQHVSEALLILPQHFGVLAEQPQHLDQQVAEVGGVERLQPRLVGLVELDAAPVREGRGFARRHLVGREPAVLPAVDDRREHAAGPALLVDVLGLQQLLQQPDLVVDVEDGEVGLQADQLGVAAQDLHADRMERAEPRHALDHLADHRADAQLHLARRLVGEGDGEDFGGARAAEREDVGDARGQHARLAGSGAGEHQHRAVQRLDRGALLRIEAGEIGRRDLRARARRDPAGGRGTSGELLTRNL